MRQWNSVVKQRHSWRKVGFTCANQPWRLQANESCSPFFLLGYFDKYYSALRAISGISDELLGPLSRSLDEAATAEPGDRSGTLLDVETGAYRIQVLED